MSERALAVRIQALQSVSETVAESLADMIYGGRLRPGERLVQSRLAEQFGVSRVPVRDALRWLEQRNLVVTRPRRGVVVRPISGSEVRDAFALRRVLEPIAMEQVVWRITQRDIAYLEAMIDAQRQSTQRGDMAAVVREDQRFHDLIFSLAENRILKEMIANLWSRIHHARSVVRVSDRGREIGEKSLVRHRDLLDALRQRDAGLARTVCIRMVEVAERDILAELEQLGWIETGRGGPR